MKKKTYSKSETKRMLILGIVIFSCNLLALLSFAIVDREHLLVKLGFIGVDCLIITFYFFLIYTRIFRPAMQMEELIEQYRNGEKRHYKGRVEIYDMVQETKNIISSLETIAIKQKNAEILMKVAEINNLQDQINPHFLYNTLEVIRGEAMLKGDRKIAEMTEALANYFRYNISRKETFVYLKDELKNIMNYFNIQKNRFGKKISCEILYHDVEQQEIQNCYLPKLILQPIIENCIYHGLEMKIGPGKISIHITATDGNLRIDVADDGLGMSQEKLDELNQDIEDIETPLSEENITNHNGVAMKNIKKRLKLYWNNNAYMITTSDLGYGTEVHLMLPLLYEKEDYMER